MLMDGTKFEMNVAIGMLDKAERRHFFSLFFCAGTGVCV